MNKQQIEQEIINILSEDEKRTGNEYMDKDLVEGCLVKFTNQNPQHIEPWFWTPHKVYTKNNAEIIWTFGLSSILRYVVSKFDYDEIALHFTKDLKYIVFWRFDSIKIWYMPLKELTNYTLEEMSQLLELIKELWMKQENK